MSKASRALSTWETLIKSLPTMTEDQLSKALEMEVAKPLEERRLDIVKRLHSRLTRIRRDRERREYMS